LKWYLLLCCCHYYWSPVVRRTSEPECGLAPVIGSVTVLEVCYTFQPSIIQIPAALLALKTSLSSPARRYCWYVSSVAGGGGCQLIGSAQGLVV
jgi:hypothetical protein